MSSILTPVLQRQSGRSTLTVCVLTAVKRQFKHRLVYQQLSAIPPASRLYCKQTNNNKNLSQTAVRSRSEATSQQSVRRPCCFCGGDLSGPRQSLEALAVAGIFQTRSPEILLGNWQDTSFSNFATNFAGDTIIASSDL